MHDFAWRCAELFAVVAFTCQSLSRPFVDDRFERLWVVDSEQPKPTFSLEVGNADFISLGLRELQIFLNTHGY